MRLIVATTLFAAMLYSGNAFAAGAVHLDFAHAVRMALKSSPRLQESRGRLRSAKGAATAAEGMRWPSLSVSLTGARTNNPLAVFGYKLSQRKATFADFGAGQFTGPGSLGVAPQALDYPGVYDNFDTALEIKWPIYAGGQMSAAVAAARAAVKAAQNGNLAARQAVILQVLRAYEGLRAASAHLAVARRAQAAADSDLASAQKRFKQGTAIRSDVLTAQVNYDQSRLMVQRARDHLATAREYLRLLTGLPQGAAIALGPPANPQMPPAPLVTLQREAEAANPTLHVLLSQVKVSRASVAGKKAAYRPHFALMLRRDWNDRSLGFSAPSYTVAGVVSWDIFDFGARHGSVEQAKGDLDAAEARVTAFRRELRIGVDRAWRSAREAESRVKTDETAVEQAREAQRIVKLRFDQSLATITALLAGQARLDKARANLVDARYDLRVSRAALLAAVGQLSLSHIASAAVATPASGTALAAATGDSL